MRDHVCTWHWSALWLGGGCPLQEVSATAHLPTPLLSSLQKSESLCFLVCLTGLGHEGRRVSFNGGGQGVIIGFRDLWAIQLETWQAVAGAV